MSKQVKYDSSRERDSYTSHPGRPFSLEWTIDPGKCQLFVLSEQASAVLRSMLQVFPKYYWVWGIEGPQRDWTQGQWDEWDAIQEFVSELEGTLVAGCDLQAFIDEQRRLTAAIVGESITIGEEEIDYTSTGLIPTLNNLFIAPVSWLDDLGGIIQGERTTAEILKTGLIGRLIDLTPTPGEGKGAANIFDELITQLDSRFRQTDYHGLSTEKNITETFEALLRIDSNFDWEWKPNLVTAIRQIFTVGAKPGETYEPDTLDKIKAAIGNLIDRSRLPGFIKDFLKSKVDVKQHLDTGDLLLMIADILKQVQSSTANIDASTIINLLNNVECAPGTNGNGNGTGNNSKITITDEGVSVEGDQPLLEGGG